MAEAVRTRESRVLKVDRDIESLPVVNDPLPTVIKDADGFVALTTSDEPVPEKVKNQTALMSRHGTAHEATKIASESASYIPYSVLSSALTECSYDYSCSKVLEIGTAPLLIEPMALNEFNFEYSLPTCYSLDELKNLYSNSSASMIDVLENEFLEEAYSDNILPRSEEVEDLTIEPFALESDSCTEHPLLRLISVYAGNLLLWNSTREALNSKIAEMSSDTKSVWELKRHSEILKGKCRDDCEVSFKLDYETAYLNRDRLEHLDLSQRQLRQFLLDRISMASFRVAASRLEIESYLIQILKQCPAYAKFSSNEPIILLPTINLDRDLDRQVKLLRNITSVLFTCLRQYVFHDVADNETVPHFELIDDIIEWIMCITGRLIRQCRFQDHIFVAMHLLRVPFSINYTPASGSSLPLSALLQPPALDIALFRVEGRVFDFLTEPEVEIRGTLLALCLKNPKKRFISKLRAHLDHKEFRSDSSESEKQPWTIIDSDGESDVECSYTSANSRKPSLSSLPVLHFDTDPDSVSMESISVLIDQIDVPGLIDFMLFRCNEKGSQNDPISLFAFANWLITTLEHNADFLHRPSSEYPRLQRQIVKRITMMVSTLLSGLRLRIECSISTLSTSSWSTLYPNCHGDDLTHLKVILAQYDELCLRVTNFILSIATSQTTLTTCWNRFARLTPLKLFSSRSKLRFYSLLLSSISSDIEDPFISNLASQPVKETSVRLEETVAQEINYDVDITEVASLLRSGLIDAGCLADPFVTMLGRLASLECRSPLLLHDGEEPHLWLSNDIPVMERLLVQRILDILFRLCIVPTTSQVRSNKPGRANPVATACGRTQILSIISSHPAFAFRHLLDLILASASQLDTQTIASTKASRGPDFKSSTNLLFELVDALPLTLFTPTTCDLETLLSWIGGTSTGEILSLDSLRCSIARKLLSNFPWEAVNNATGDYLIPLQVQATTAIAIATAFQRHIMEIYQQPVSRISDILNSYAKSVWTQRSVDSTRSASTSPPRIRSSTVLQPPVPLDHKAASFYHWTMRLILRFHLEPSTEALTHLLSATEMSDNPLTTFLALELRPRQQPSSPLFADEDACRVLVALVKSGHFALAIEAFSRLSIYHRTSKKYAHTCSPCRAFRQFVFCMLGSDKTEVEKGFLLNSLWDKWSNNRRKHDKVKMELNTSIAASRGPVLEAFLGATLNACIGAAGVDENHSLLNAVISSTLAFLLANPHSQSQAVWMLENCFKTAFWVEKSFSTPSISSHLSEWWKQPILRLLQSSSLEESSIAASKAEDTESRECVPNLASQNYRSISSSWSEGLSSLFTIEGIQQYITYFRPSASGVHDEDSVEALRLTLIQDLLKNVSENDTEVLWSIAYLIGAECNADNVFGGYSLWDDVVDSITWNRATLLAENIASSTSSSRDAVDPEKCLLCIFVNGGILPSGSSLDHLSHITQHLPLIQAISVLTICPPHQPVFFLLLQLAVDHCLAFSRVNDSLSTDDSDSCFPPGFLLLRTLQWSGHNLTADHGTNTRMTVLEVFLCRLREALRYWLKKDSQDDCGDPYGLRSSNAISLLRNIISLLSDLQQTATHGISDAIQVTTLVERIKSLDVKSAPQSVSLDAIMTTIYSHIERWHFLRGTHEPIRDQSSSSKDKSGNVFERSSATCPSRRLDPPRVQQYLFDENSIYGPEDPRPDEWHSLIQACVEILKGRAFLNKERDLRLERLYRKLLETILPNLYKPVKLHRSEVVECHPFIQIPLVSPRVCKGGAHIFYHYETSHLETSVETESTETICGIKNLIKEALSAASDIVTVSCRHIVTISDSPRSAEFPQREYGSNWVLAAFRMIVLIQRIVMFQTLATECYQNEARLLVNIFHLLVHSTTAVTYNFPPIRGVFLQCLQTISEYLLSSGSCRYDVVLDALASSPQLLQLLPKLWPRLLEVSVRAKPGSRAKHFLAIYRLLPLIVQQCGPNVAFDLLNMFPPLLEETPGNAHLSTHSSNVPGKFGGVAQLDSLILEAFQCLLTVNKIIKQKEGSTELVELIQERIMNYFEFNFPHSIAHLLEEFSSAKTQSTHEKLWHLVKCSISTILSHQEEYPISTDDMKNFFDKVNKCASLAYSIRDLPTATRSDIIESLGILIQQLAIKLSRCVELDHLPLQQGLNILVEMVLSSLWTQAIGLTNEVQQSAAEQLSILTEILYIPMETPEAPRLFNAFLDFIMTHLFCDSSKLNSVVPLEQFNQSFTTRRITSNLPENFPWGVWQPATSVIVKLTRFINELSRSVNGSALSALSYVLSRVNFCDLKLETSVAEHMDNIVALMIAVVSCYDAHVDRQDSSSSTENLQCFIKNCHRFLLQQYAFARLSPANVSQIKAQLRPNTIITTSNPVFCDFFKFLSTASHIDRSQMENSRDVSIDIAQQRQAFINLCVDFLLAVASPETLNLPVPAENQSVEVVSTSSTAENTASRAYSLVTSILPVAGTALGRIVNTVSSSFIWKRVFGEEDSSKIEEAAFATLVESGGPLKAFALQILSLLDNVGNCCYAECWSPVESQGFQQAVSYYGELLRLRSVNTSLSKVVDATFLHWVSEVRTSVSCKEAFQCKRISGHCRPLLQVLLSELSAFSLSLSTPVEAAKLKTVANPMGTLNLIDTSLWVLLQSSPEKCSIPCFPTNFEEQMMRVGEIVAYGCKNATEETPSLIGCGSWLIPACLSCKKLLPLFVCANNRWRVIAPATGKFGTDIRNQRGRPSISAIDTPAILLADIMHWLAVLNLQPPDVCSESCLVSPQLSGLLLIFNLNIRLISSMRESEFSSMPQEISRSSSFLNYLVSLVAQWEGFVKSSATPQPIVNFIEKFNIMSNCVLGLMEEWCGTRDSEDFERTLATENAHGLERLHKLVSGTSNRDADHHTVAVVRALLARLHSCADIDDLLISYNFLCQKLWSPLPSVLEYFFSLPSTPR